MSVRARRAASSRPASPVPEIEAMITGCWLMFRALTCGLTPCGRPTVARFCSIAARVSLTSVPYENWATTSEIELAEVDWRLPQPLDAGDGPLDGLGDLLGHVGGTGPGIRRDDRDDRELDIREELLLEAAPGVDTADEHGDREEQRDASPADGELG